MKEIKSPWGGDGCVYYLSEEEGAKLATDFKNFEFNAYIDFGEYWLSNWKIVIQPKTGIIKYTGSIEVEIYAAMPNPKYRFFYSS